MKALILFTLFITSNSINVIASNYICEIHYVVGSDDDEKKSFHKKINKIINEFEGKIENLKKDMRKSGKKTDENFDRNVRKLKASLETVKYKADKLDKKADKDWDNFKNEVEIETQKFENDVNKFIDSIKSNN